LLPDLDVTIRRLEAVRLRLLREADRQGVGVDAGHASTASWWARTTMRTRPEAHRQVALAASLDDDAHAPVASAAGAGAVSPGQAAVIIDAVEALPAELVPPHTRRHAQTHLLDLAARHDPRELRILGRKILEVVAPDIAEDHERRILERQEQHAAATASFTMRPDGHGSMIGRFKIPALAGEILGKHLSALAAPKRHPGEEKVSRPLRLGTAFTEYIETRTPDDTPRAGGVPATVVVTMTLADLLGAGKAATLDTGDTISASEARRLACEAGIIPAVLGTRSQVLDLGRKTRFHTEPQRIALALRDRGCAAEHCDWPPGMCHAHHATPWARGGATSVADGMLLCPRHHALAHDTRYQSKTAENGKVTFTRRT
jgi:hypothetical protein